MRWVLDAACSFFLGAQVEMQKKIRKIPDSFHQVGSKTHAPRHTGTRTHTHTHVLVENGGDLPGVHIVPTIYIYAHCATCAIFTAFFSLMLYLATVFIANPFH